MPGLISHRASNRALVQDSIRGFRTAELGWRRAPHRAVGMVFSDTDDDGDYAEEGGNISDGQLITKVNRKWTGLINEYKVKGTIPADGREFHPVQSVKAYLNHRRATLVRIITRHFRESGMVKVQLRLNIEMRLPSMEEADTHHFASFNLPVVGVGDIPAVLRTIFDQLEEEVDNYVNRGSGWKLINVDFATLHVSKYEANHMVGAIPQESKVDGAGQWVPLPSWVISKKATCNPGNKHDDYCFHYCMEMAMQFHVGDERVDVRNRDRDCAKLFPISEASFDYSSVTFPVQTRQLDAFERDNAKWNIAVSVLGVGEKLEEGYHWVRPSPRIKQQDAWIVHLLVLFNDKTDDHHYVLVKPGKLRALLIPGTAAETTSNRLDVCERCLWSGTGETMRLHRENMWCMQQPIIKTVLPKPGENMQYFKDYAKMQECDYYVSADFECFLKPTADDPRVMHTHIASQWGLYVHSTFDRSFSEYFSLRAVGPEADMGAVFITTLEAIGEMLVDKLREPRYNNKLDMTAESEARFQAATHCHLCQLPFEGGHHPFWKHVQRKAKDKKVVSVEDSQEADGSEDEEDEDEDDIPAEAKVRDHDHRVAKDNYRNAAHQACNLQYRRGWKNGHPTRQWYVPVFFHNLKGYDSHLIIGSLSKQHQLKSLKVIPQQGESFLSFEFSNFRFIDSLSFLQGSLDSAIANLVKGIKKPNGEVDIDRIWEAFPHTYEQFTNPSLNKTDSDPPKGTTDPELQLQLLPDDPRFPLLLRKGVFPYEYMSSPSRFQETALPPRELFYSSLSGKTISEADYAHAQAVWTAFGIKNLGEYQDLYMKMDTVQSADCMQKVIDTCREAYRGLNPGQYISAPSLSAAANLLCKPHRINPVTGLTEPFMLELCDESDNGRAIYEFCERNKRGGITNIPGRHAEADEKSDIAYLDATNLYGYAMSQKLPLSEFQMWDEDLISDCLPEADSLNEALLSMDCDGDLGYWVTVDVNVPADLHCFTSDYPLFPVRRAVQLSETSPHYQQMLASIPDAGGKLALSHDDKTEKLILDLHPKEKYSILLKHLKLCIGIGAVVTRVHAVLQYRQEAWMASYIQKNTDMRNQAKDEASKAFFKLMNNACYGKFLQDDRKHRNVTPVVHDKDMMKALRDPLTAEIKLIRGDQDGKEPLAMVERIRRHVKLDKPLLVGITILELSKVRMYDFYYKLKRLLKGDMCLLMTDTDSLVLHIKRRQRSDGSYERWEERLVEAGMQDEMDFSVYQEEHPAVQLLKAKGLNPRQMKGIVGSMKNEYPSMENPIVGFVGLRPKMYATKFANDEEMMKAKGVKKDVLKRYHDYAAYLRCLFADADWTIQRHRMVGIHSKNQQLRTDVITKQTLSPLDSKRYMVDAVLTLPYGHCNIPLVESQACGFCQERWLMERHSCDPADCLCELHATEAVMTAIHKRQRSTCDDVERPSKAPRLVGIHPHPGPEEVHAIQHKIVLEHIKWRCPRFTASYKVGEHGREEYLPHSCTPSDCNLRQHYEKGTALYMSLQHFCLVAESYEPEEICVGALHDVCHACWLHTQVFPPAPRLVGVHPHPGPKVQKMRRGRKPRPTVPGDSRAVKAYDYFFEVAKVRWYLRHEPMPQVPLDLFVKAIEDCHAFEAKIDAMELQDLPGKTDRAKGMWREEAHRYARRKRLVIEDDMDLFWPGVPIPTPPKPPPPASPPAPALVGVEPNPGPIVSCVYFCSECGTIIGQPGKCVLCRCSEVRLRPSILYLLERWKLNGTAQIPEILIHIAQYAGYSLRGYFPFFPELRESIGFRRSLCEDSGAVLAAVLADYGEADVKWRFDVVLCTCMRHSPGRGLHPGRLEAIPSDPDDDLICNLCGEDVSPHAFCWTHLSTENICHGAHNETCNCKREPGMDDWCLHGDSPELPSEEFPFGWYGPSSMAYHPGDGKERWITGAISEDEEDAEGCQAVRVIPRSRGRGPSQWEEPS